MSNLYFNQTSNINRFCGKQEGVFVTGIFLETGPLCIATDSKCPNSSKYLLFDSVHPGFNHPGQEAYQFIYTTIQVLVQKTDSKIFKELDL